MSRPAILILFAALFFSCAINASAQTTIFNVPLADTLQRGTVAIEADFVAKPVRNKKGGYQSYGYRLAYGLRNKTEIGSNFYYSWDGRDPAGQAEFSLKQKFYEDERRGVKVTGGGVAFIPLKATRGERRHFMTYANASKTIKRANGLTLTGGIYHISGGGRDFGTRTGAIVGIVQPISQRLSLVADWYSGANRLGYSSVGFNVNITKQQYLTAGYSFGNEGRGNNNLAVFYGFIF